MEPVRLLRERGREPHIHFANSNIAPAEEYARRRDTIAQWTQDEGVGFTEGAYRPLDWEREVTNGGPGPDELRSEAAQPSLRSSRPEPFGGLPTQGEAGGALGGETRLVKKGGKRAEQCRRCYRMRFAESARYARENGFDALGTTLSVSPYQYTDIIREELERACAAEGIGCFFEDYSPYYPQATRRSKDAGMYRQDYCGCLLSKAEADAQRAQRKAERAARRAERAHARQAEEAALQARRAERAAYDAKQARKRAVLKALRASTKEER